MGKTNSREVVTATRVSPTVRARLQADADREDRSVCSVIRHIITTYYAQHPPAAQ